MADANAKPIALYGITLRIARDVAVRLLSMSKNRYFVTFTVVNLMSKNRYFTMA